MNHISAYVQDLKHQMRYLSLNSDVSKFHPSLPIAIAVNHVIRAIAVETPYLSWKPLVTSFVSGLYRVSLLKAKALSIVALIQNFRTS